MTGYALYGGVPPHEKARTSLEAAISIAPFANTMQERVYRWVAQRGMNGATVNEIETSLNMLHQSASARARELVQLGKLRNTGKTRRTMNGRNAYVLVASGAAEVPMLEQEPLF